MFTALAHDGDDRERNARLFAMYGNRVRELLRARLERRLPGNLVLNRLIERVVRDAVAACDPALMRSETSWVLWIVTLAESDAVAYLSKHTADFASSTARDPIDAELEPEMDAVARADARALIDECIAELSPEYQAMISWREIAHADWTVVAEETGCASVASARALHARALVELAQLLRERTDME